jgi:hypothetical protein
MKKQTKSLTTKIILLLVAVLVLIAIGRSIANARTKNATVRPFAQCLTEKGAKFYGAYWCPHCSAQKRMFGAAVKDLPYIECATPDGKGQMQVCTDAGIQSYPTWIFADGSQLNGEQSFQELSDKTGCALPGTN